MNRKQKLMDFYLFLLSFPPSDMFRGLNQPLYAAVRDTLAKEVGCTPEEVQSIFERMAQEDR